MQKRSRNKIIQNYLNASSGPKACEFVLEFTIKLHHVNHSKQWSGDTLYEIVKIPEIKHEHVKHMNIRAKKFNSKRMFEILNNHIDERYSNITIALMMKSPSVEILERNINDTIGTVDTDLIKIRLTLAFTVLKNL